MSHSDGRRQPQRSASAAGHDRFDRARPLPPAVVLAASERGPTDKPRVGGLWSSFALDSDKDALIDKGEIGLSQVLLSANVELRARHGLIEMLLDGEHISQRLNRFKVHEPRDINLSLHGWQDLLDAGCPLLKKHVLFNLGLSPQVPIPLTDLHPYLNHADQALRNDLQKLLQSRHLVP